jgi:hypothetical protein
MSKLPSSLNTRSSLATPDQVEVERTALRLFQRPELQQALANTRAQFLADPVAKMPAGAATLEHAVNDTVMTRIIAVILDDIARPRIVWVDVPEHEWFGYTMPGSRHLIDNPDCPYRTAILDPAGSYEINGQRVNGGQLSFSFQLYADNTYGTVLPGTEAAPKAEASLQDLIDDNIMDTPLEGLLGEDMVVAQDGSYTVTVSPQPANGQANHIQTRPDALALLIRCALSDWEHGCPDLISIKRLDQPEDLMPLTDDELVKNILATLKKDVPFWLKFNHVFWFDNPANKFPVPFARGGDFGYGLMGNFKLASDEVLMIVLNPHTAKYTGITVYNPWSISCEYIERSGSLNNTQTQPNADGSYTYIVAAKDPGIANWLDTGGLDCGGVCVRWQAFPKQPATGDDLIREVRVIKIDQIDEYVGSDTPRFHPAQRQQELKNRAKAFKRRFIE